MGKKINELSLYHVLNRIPNNVPIEIIKELSTWKRIIKSPYSHSYYTEPVDWNTKPDKSLRIADHWNFESQCKLHCCTTTTVQNNTHWTIARFNLELGLYEPIASYPKQTESVKTHIEFRLLHLTIAREFKTKACVEALKDNVNKIKDALSVLELKYLNKYYKILEESLVN